MAADFPAGGIGFVPPDGAEAGWMLCRRVRRDDEAALYESISASLDHLRPWMPWAENHTPATEAEFVERNTAAAPGEAVSDAPYLAVDRDGRLLGGCGLHGRVGSGGLEIGYWVDARHTRRGVATLSAALLTEIGLSIPGIEAIQIHHDAANAVSGRVPARLGFTHVATVEREPAAAAETGVEWQWRMEQAAWPASPGARLLAEARADAPSSS